MPPKKKNTWQEHALFFKALAHPTRLQILTLLLKQPQYVHALVEKINVDFSTVSNHLRILRAAGLVIGEKQGQWVKYRIRARNLQRLLRCAETHLSYLQSGKI
jgi:ArsR family transcriptional regulator